MLDAHLFGDGDLDVVDVPAVPDRLEKRVREAEREDVPHRVLAQVVVDPEDPALFEDAGQDFVQRSRRRQVAAERFLRDDARPGAVLR